MNKNDNPDLLELSLEITVYGVLLSIIMPLTSHRLDAAGVATICCFLAAVFAFRLLLPVRAAMKYFWVRLLSVALCATFSWWLIYQAENTRAGWYRFHVLQARVQQLISKAPAYVITCDADGYITGSSDNIHMLVGWTKSEILGSHVHMFMREEKRALHDSAFEKAVATLRDASSSTDAGWTLQGVMTLGICHKDGTIVPVKAYAGGIRWSQDIHFSGDIDIFAVFSPVSHEQARDEPTTIDPASPLQIVPPAKPVDNDEPSLLVVPGTQGRILPP